MNSLPNKRRAIEDRPISALIPYATNARTHSDAQVAQISASIREFGWTNPILVDGQNGIIAGHGRVMAARKLGMTQVPCIELDGLNEAQKRAYVIADNRLAENAGWDEGLLAAEFGHLADLDFDLELTGFELDDISAIQAAQGATEGLTDPDEVPDAPDEPITARGDLWVLGRHRVLCGDATSTDAVDKLMAGHCADLCLTDPPYGLGAGKESGKNNYDEYQDTRGNLIQLAKDWLPLARRISDAVVFSPGVTNQWLYPEPNWVICWFYGGGQLRSSWGFNCWQPFLCYGKDPSLASGNGGRPDAVDMNVPSNSKELNHPCPKPVKLWSWFMDRLIFSTTAILFEPFCGSGTTIISAELKNIACFGMEISPAYCDVIIKRWQDFTGEQATLESNGKTFEEITQTRAQKESRASAA